MGSLSGKVVVVTGASAGVGRALTRRLAQAGARLALIAREAEALEETRAEVERLGVASVALSLDMADADAVAASGAEIEARLGQIDIWINNAMVTVFSPVSEITPEEFRRVTEVTYLGYVHGTMAALRQMKTRDRGLIVQIGSALAYRAIPLQAAYCGAKHAVRGFTDALRTELLHDHSGIQLMMAQLPAVNTPQFDWARTHMPEEPRPAGPVTDVDAVAEAICRAILKPRREVWIGTSTMKAILGNTLAPWYLDRLLARTTYEGQGRGTPAAARAGNLYEPVAGLHRADGSFKSEASRFAPAVSGVAARTAAAVAGLGVAALAGFLLAAVVVSPERRRSVRRTRHRR